jgi:hypothetical protein
VDEPGGGIMDREARASRAASRGKAGGAGSAAGSRSTLDVERILRWADAHRTATGQWPDPRSGPVGGVGGETWSAIDAALRRGRRGLPGGSSLAGFLAEERGVTEGANPESPAERLRAWEAEQFPTRRPRRRAAQPRPKIRLTIDQILFWADAEHAATGQWPRYRCGTVPDHPEISWGRVNHALRMGIHGLPGGTTLADLMQDHRGVYNKQNLPHLDVEQILAWADAQHAATGRWPANNSGPVRDHPELNWSQLNRALRDSSRGLPGGTTLADLLQEQRGVRNKQNLPRLDVEQILTWADAHREATGEYPQGDSGAVREAPRETWNAIQSALSKGLRGLPGGSSVAQLLAERREYRSMLTLERILAWADAHFAATGRWPTSWSSGAVRDVDCETWQNLDACLRDGRRGLPGGTTLAHLLAERRQAPNIYTETLLTVEHLLDWADAHFAATGRWPSSQSGPVLHAEGENWGSIETALREGYRGLPGGQALGRLIRDHGGPDVYRTRPILTVEQILAWADAHREATGDWPVENAGPVREATGESWNAISIALSKGGRGLPGGSSLARLLAEHRGARNPKNLPRLTVEQILSWADAHRAATGRWPASLSGPVAEGSEETWVGINTGLIAGFRGLPGGSSLAKLLAEHRPVKLRLLSIQQIRTWAGVHREATGRWPDAHAGPVRGVPDETWSAVDAALRFGRRGLPGGSSLTTLFERSLDPAARGIRPVLTVEQVLAWADAHFAATGRWPTIRSGQVDGVPGEKWVNLEMALKHGRRGLPSGKNLTRFIAEHRGTRGPLHAVNPVS